MNNLSAWIKLNSTLHMDCIFICRINMYILFWFPFVGFNQNPHKLILCSLIFLLFYTPMNGQFFFWNHIWNRRPQKHKMRWFLHQFKDFSKNVQFLPKTPLSSKKIYRRSELATQNHWKWFDPPWFDHIGQFGFIGPVIQNK